MPKTQGCESHASEYDQWFNENPEIYQAEIEAIRQLLPEGKGIEIGAGNGRMTKPLNIDSGIEPAKAMREIAQEQGLKVIDGMAESLTIADKSFEYALFITSTCFLDDPQTAYKEAARVIKDKGSIIIAFLEKNSELGKIYEAHKHESPFYCDATFYSYKEIQNFLSTAGFSDFKTLQTVLPESLENAQTHDILSGHDKGTFIVVRAEKQ